MKKQPELLAILRNLLKRPLTTPDANPIYVRLTYHFDGPKHARWSGLAGGYEAQGRTQEDVLRKLIRALRL